MVPIWKQILLLSVSLILGSVGAARIKTLPIKKIREDKQ